MKRRNELLYTWMRARKQQIALSPFWRWTGSRHSGLAPESHLEGNNIWDPAASSLRCRGHDFITIFCLIQTDYSAMTCYRLLRQPRYYDRRIHNHHYFKKIQIGRVYGAFFRRTNLILPWVHPSGIYFNHDINQFGQRVLLIFYYCYEGFVMK